MQNTVSCLRSGTSTLPRRNFIVLYGGKHKMDGNTYADASPNVMFGLRQDLQTIDGPTLMNFVDSLLPDEQCPSLHDCNEYLHKSKLK